VTERRLVGIAMVRDEDVFVDRAVRNALNACDEFILVDHRSRDATAAILTRIRDEFPEKVSFHRVRRAGEANLLLRRFVGEPVWVLAVDGDELYEPARLALVRESVLRGDFDDWWMVKGNNLHCTSLDVEGGTATGYLAPPSRSITKLFNFAALESWTGTAAEHLYGGQRRFKRDFAAQPIYLLRDECSWAESPFRCLHVCFLPRSSHQPAASHTRRGVLESYGYGRINRARASLKMAFGRPSESAWKLEKYRQGDLVTVDDIAGFFPQPAASAAST
jgi:glycosyltransferase involved in cell wall biosynthesis